MFSVITDGRVRPVLDGRPVEEVGGVDVRLLGGKGGGEWEEEGEESEWFHSG